MCWFFVIGCTFFLACYFFFSFFSFFFFVLVTVWCLCGEVIFVFLISCGEFSLEMGF